MFSFWHSKSETNNPNKKSTASSVLEPVTAANRQGLNKAGIIITKELEEAIHRCRNKVQRITKECRRSNRRFRDAEFDLLDDKERCLHGLSRNGSSGPTYYPSDVLRVNQIFENPSFFINGATASDISQGSTIGDCWFLSGMSLIATAGLIEKICVERDEHVGVYGFIFWRDAGWVDVIIDDLLFVQIPKWREVDETTRMMYKYDQDAYLKQARKGSKILYFSKSATENETWVPLLEKAYAKLHGDYASLDGGFTHEAIEDLSGAVSNWMYIRDTLDPERFWNEELLKANEDRLFACSIVDAYAVNDDGRRWRDPLNGLVAQHAYSVVKALECKGVKFVKIRNPWGSYEWQGRWSDGSKEWTGEWLDALKALDYKFGNDGEFLMEYNDFLNTWDSIERCRLFDDKWALSQLWLQVRLGEYPRPTNFGDVSFTVSLSQTTSAVLMLSQLDTRYFLGVDNQYKFSLSFVVFKAGDKEPIAASYHDALWRRSVNVELNLEAGDYVVQVKIDRDPPSGSPYTPLPLPVPLPNPNYPTPPAPLPAAPFPVPSYGALGESRKKVQKKTELLISASVAANFRPSDYGVNMPLPPDIFHGVDLTSMEVTMFEGQTKFNAEKKLAFAPKKAENNRDGGGKVNETQKATQEALKGLESAVVTVDCAMTTEGDGATKFKTEDELTKSSKVDQSPTTFGASSMSSGANENTRSSETNIDNISTTTPDSASDDPHAESNSKSKDDKPSEEKKESNTVHMDQSPSLPAVPVVQSVTPQTSESSKPLHEGYYCDGHGGQILGTRFHCLDIACPDYDLCEKCMGLGVHNTNHQMLEIKDPDRELIDNNTALPTSDDVMTIGLKVYASKDCEVNIKGQLRHKDIIRNYVTMSRII